VVGVPVALGDVGVSGLLDRFRECMIAWCEAFAGGDDEDRTRRDLRGEVEQVERLLVRADFAASARPLVRRAGEVVVFAQLFASSAAVEGLLSG